MSNTSVDTIGMDVGVARVTIAPLLKSCFSMCNLRAADGARGAPSRVCCLLRVDGTLAASSTNASAWCSDVMREESGRHLGVIVSADRVSQLSVNDGFRNVCVTCDLQCAVETEECEW